MSDLELSDSDDIENPDHDPKHWNKSIWGTFQEKSQEDMDTSAGPEDNSQDGRSRSKSPRSAGRGRPSRRTGRGRPFRHSPTSRKGNISPVQGPS